MNTPNCTVSNSMTAGPQRKVTGYRRTAAGLASVALALALLLLLLLGGSASVSAEAVGETPPVDVVILIDSSRSMVLGENIDPGANRIQFTQLLARYLAAFSPDSRLAVALFTSQINTNTIVLPLTPVQDLLLGSGSTTSKWIERAEVACPLFRPQDANYPAPEVPPYEADPCYGTDYVEAFTWAQDQLANCSGDAKARCHIFVFTDMGFGDPDAASLDQRVVSSADEVKQKLEALSQQNIKTHVISFGDTVEPGQQAAENTWRGWKEQGLIADFVDGAQEGLDWQTYDQLLNALGFAPRPNIPIEAGDTASRTLVPISPLNIGTASVRLLADTSAFTWTFSAKPSFSQNHTFFWNEAALSLPLEITITARSEPVTIYYEVLTSTRPLEVSIAALPPLATGQRFTVTATLDIGRDLIGPDMKAVTATITGQDKATELTYAGGNRWSGVLTTPAEAGTYTLTVFAQPLGWGELAIYSRLISVEEVALPVNEPPAIQLDVAVPSAAPGSQITITVSVPADSDLVPVLHIQSGGDDPYTQTMTADDGQRYTATVNMPASGDLLLWATGGEGSAFANVNTAPKMVEPVAPTPTVTLTPTATPTPTVAPTSTVAPTTVAPLSTIKPSEAPTITTPPQPDGQEFHLDAVLLVLWALSLIIVSIAVWESFRAFSRYRKSPRKRIKRFDAKVFESIEHSEVRQHYNDVVMPLADQLSDDFLNALDG